MPTPSTSATALPSDVLARVEGHLGHPPSGAQPLQILASHLSALPPSLLAEIGSHTTPRERTSIPAIKARRVLYSAAEVKPEELSADEGRRRWPRMWERLGGDPRAYVSRNQKDAAEWADQEFMAGNKGFVGRLASALAEEEEIREWEETRANRVREMREEGGEEFDDSSDEEEEEEEGRPVGPHGLRSVGTGDEDQDAVVKAFERQLTELFIEGLDTVNYDQVDFVDREDPIAEREAQDAWFDDEPPIAASSAGNIGNGATRGSKVTENGQGDYDY